MPRHDCFPPCPNTAAKQNGSSYWVLLRDFLHVQMVEKWMSVSWMVDAQRVVLNSALLWQLRTQKQRETFCETVIRMWFIAGVSILSLSRFYSVDVKIRVWINILVFFFLAGVYGRKSISMVCFQIMQLWSLDIHASLFCVKADCQLNGFSLVQHVAVSIIAILTEMKFQPKIPLISLIILSLNKMFCLRQHLYVIEGICYSMDPGGSTKMK